MPADVNHQSTIAVIRIAAILYGVGFLAISPAQVAVAQNPVEPATYEQPILRADPAVGPAAIHSDLASLPGSTQTPISLRRPGADSASANAGRGGGSNWISIVGSLSMVLALFFAVAWVTRRRSPTRMQALPAEVLAVLGRVPLGTRQNAQLVRVGSKLLLVAISEGDVTTLTEITDPAEVERLTELCQREVAIPPRGLLAFGLGRFGLHRTETSSLQGVAPGQGSSLDLSETAHRDLGRRRHA